MKLNHAPEFRRNTPECDAMFPDTFETTNDKSFVQEYVLVGKSERPDYHPGEKVQLCIFSYQKNDGYSETNKWYGGCTKEHLKGFTDLTVYKVNVTHTFIKEPNILPELLNNVADQFKQSV